MPPNSSPPPVGAAGNVVALDPLERRRPGRPRSIGRAPDEHERERHRRLQARLQAFVEADAVVKATSVETARTSTSTVDQALLSVARECAGMKWEREQAQARGRPGSEKIASRRIDGLSRLANLILERTRAGADDGLDPFNPKFQRVVALFLQQMRACAEETLTADVAAGFLSRFEAKVRGWEDRV